MKRSKTTEAAPANGRSVMTYDLPIITDCQMDVLASLFGQVIDLDKLVAANDNVSEV